MTYPTRHWTDDAASPVFSTVIDATGPGGNVAHVLAEACAMLRHLDVPADRIEALRARVGTAQSYDEAVAYVEAWFPVRRDA